MASITLNWSAALPQPGTSIALYTIYRQTSDGSWPPIATVPGTSQTYTDAGLTTLTTYAYYVTAIDTKGAVSIASNRAQATTFGTLPSTPTNLAVSAVTTTTVSLSWTAASGATSYNLYRNGVKVQSNITSPVAVDTGLSASTNYTYSVSGVNVGGEGGQSVSVIGTTRAATTQAVKWNPGTGNWTESDTVIGTTGGLASIQSEIDAMAAFPNIPGYMILVYWGFLQQQSGTYTFTNLDTIVNYIKSKGKRWCLQIVAGVFNYGTNPPTSASNSPVPAYINNGNTSQWGQAGTRANGVTTILAGQSGWWGGDGNGHTYGAALWRPAIMAEWIKLHQAVAAKYESDPSFELIHQGEDSFYQGTGSTNNSDYNDATMRQNWKNWLQACCAAFPTTNVSFSETFLQFQSSSIDLTNYITDNGKPYQNHPPLMGQTDSIGAVQRSAIHTWGSETYAGLLGTLGDRRPLGRFVAEVQAPDLGFFANLGSPREDVKAGLDIMGCTHAFWAIVPSPISQVTLPNKYPCTFTANPTGTSGTLASPWPLNTGQYDLITTPGGRGNFTKGSTAVTFTVAQSSTAATISIKYPLVPSNWSNGGTATSTQNGTSTSYTDAGLLAWINDPANALANTAYPVDYP